jgi:hypothetical protein
VAKFKFLRDLIGMLYLVDPAWIAAFSLLLLGLGAAYFSMKT